MPPSGQPAAPTLAFGLRFEDLYARDGLAKLDQAFTDALREADSGLEKRYADARADPSALALKEEADLLIAVAPTLDRVVAQLFDIEAEWEALRAGHAALAPLFRVKRKFVQRRVLYLGQTDDSQKQALVGKSSLYRYLDKVLEH